MEKRVIYCFIHLCIWNNIFTNTEQEKLNTALLETQQALLVSPNSSQLRMHAGEILMRLHCKEEAEKQFIHALQCNPKEHEITLKIANNLLALGNYFYSHYDIEHALHIYEQIAQLFPFCSAIQHNIGFALAELNRPHEAIEAYEKALAIKPDHIETHFCLSTAYLAAGEYKKGWQAYEWRWKKQNKSLDDLPYPIWQGEPLDEKTLLIRAEGALGDTIQFLRYAQILKKHSVTIVLQVLSPLKILLSSCDYIDLVITNADKKPPIDFQISSMSLPYLLQTDIDTIPNTTPYLYADNNLVQLWKEKMLPYAKTFNIGICWQADLENDAQRPPLARRSIDLALFAPLTEFPNVSLFNLQKNGDRQIKKSALTIHSFGDHIDTSHGRFMDTAAIINNLDLIICVDTSIAHLAGALGIKTWVLLPFKSDWRWMTERTDSPWYPTITLFRNNKTTEWHTVIQQVCQHLQKLINQLIKKEHT